MKKLSKMEVINEARNFGQCYIGRSDFTFDSIRDTKSWLRFMKQNGIEDCNLYNDYQTGEWFIVCP